jgi:hypothetical protein
LWQCFTQYFENKQTHLYVNLAFSFLPVILVRLNFDSTPQGEVLPIFTFLLPLLLPSPLPEPYWLSTEISQSYVVLTQKLEGSRD